MRLGPNPIIQGIKKLIIEQMKTDPGEYGAGHLKSALGRLNAFGVDRAIEELLAEGKLSLRMDGANKMYSLVPNE